MATTWVRAGTRPPSSLSKQGLALSQRDRLRAAIGDRAEALVYLYAACDRAETYPRLGAPRLPLTDRFTGETVDLTGTDRTDFALLTIANELDVANTTALTCEAHQGIRALVDALAVYLPATTRALTTPLAPTPPLPHADSG
jgi:hypothetical protein